MGVLGRELRQNLHPIIWEDLHPAILRAMFAVLREMKVCPRRRACVSKDQLDTAIAGAKDGEGAL